MLILKDRWPGGFSKTPDLKPLMYNVKAFRPSPSRRKWLSNVVLAQIESTPNWWEKRRPNVHAMQRLFVIRMLGFEIE